jgi:nucleoside diphosphate-linked moiety X motif protein 19
MTKSQIQKLKQASTLIITCALKNSTQKFNYDYKIMLLKRSNKMRVAPSHHVFPGGAFDSNDESINWLSVLLKKSNPNERDLDIIKKEYHKIIHKNSLGNLAKNSDDQNQKFHLPYEISHRLCAIRETFEETGLLLVYDKTQITSKSTSGANFLTNYQENQVKNLNEWQNKVRNDSSEFLKMCLEMNLMPDLLGLHEWANWITPMNESRRFNTFFFTCFLNDMPKSNLINLDLNEIEYMNVCCIFFKTNEIFFFKVIFSLVTLI